MQQTIHTVFEVVKAHGHKYFKCACGRNLKRHITFTQTLNPWNTTADGQLKSRQQIYKELAAELETWRTKVDPCTHADKK